MFSHGTAVCVSIEESCGVVCYNTKSITCATCHYGASSCRHVTCVLDLLQTQSAPTCLKHWVVPTCTNIAESEGSSYTSCKSSVPIPWMSTLAQQEILKTKDDRRFNIQNGVAYPCLQCNCSCSKCGMEVWYGQLE